MFGRLSAIALSQTLGNLPKLKSLDISYNNLAGHDIAGILETLYIDETCKVRNLNISGNNVFNPDLKGGPIDKFSDRLQKLIKQSITLQHLDISCMSLDQSQIYTIVSKGILKSKSVISFHISGNFMSMESLTKIWDTLKVKREEEEHKENSQIVENHQKLGQDAFYDEFKEMKYQTYEIKQKLKLSEEILRPLGEINPDDRYAFTRYLGSQEIIDSFKWKQVDDRDCYICRRDSYCLFFWSPSLAESDHLKSVDKLPCEMHKQFSKMPNEEVWISVQGEQENFCKMLTLPEFMSRLDQNKRPYIRYTNDAIETQRLKDIMEDIQNRDQNILNQFVIRHRQVGLKVELLK